MNGWNAWQPSYEEEMEQELLQCASEQPSVLGVDLIQTRVFENKVYVDIEICAGGQITLTENHAIAEQVHTAIETQFSKVKHIMVHVNPAKMATGHLCDGNALSGSNPFLSEMKRGCK